MALPLGVTQTLADVWGCCATRNRHRGVGGSGGADLRRSTEWIFPASRSGSSEGGGAGGSERRVSDGGGLAGEWRVTSVTESNKSKRVHLQSCAHGQGPRHAPGRHRSTIPWGRLRRGRYRCDVRTRCPYRCDDRSTGRLYGCMAGFSTEARGRGRSEAHCSRPRSVFPWARLHRSELSTPCAARSGPTKRPVGPLRAPTGQLHCCQSFCRCFYRHFSRCCYRSDSATAVGVPPW